MPDQPATGQPRPNGRHGAERHSMQAGPDPRGRREPTLQGPHDRRAVTARASELGALGRTSQLLRFALRYRHLGTPPEHGSEPAASRHDADTFVRDLQRLGPAFVKIGQTLSTRADLLPPSYLNALERLQDDVGPVPFPAIRATLERELGVRLSKAFREFDETPLATASLAQVHAAVLRDGRDVVVKVQRPDIAEAIATDLKALGNIVGAADRFTEQGRRMHFSTWLAEVGDTLAEELDYRLEAENLQTFAQHLADYPQILVPRPYQDLSSLRVLTMDRIHGSKISQAIALRRLDEPLGALAVTLLHAYLDQIFVNGLVHADPHPGNVLLTRDDRIGLIDLGMVVRLNPRMRDALLKLLFAAVEGDGDHVAEQCMDVGEPLEMFSEREWRRRCGRLIGRYAATVEAHEPEGRLMMDLTRLAVECGLRPSPEIALLGKTLLNLDTVARLLDPHLDVRQVVRERMQRLLPSRLSAMLSPSAAAEQAYEVAELMRDMPRQMRAVLSMLAENRFTLRLSGLEESRLLENMQKIANRITAGVVTAALIIGAALVLRIDAGPTLFGYPAIALVMFTAAFLLGAVLVISMLRSDRHASRYDGRR